MSKIKELPVARWVMKVCSVPATPLVLIRACIDERQLRTIDEIAMSGNAFYYMYSWDNLHDAPPGDSR